MKHLKLAPKPLAKCSDVAPRPYPCTSGVSVRRAPIQGRWLIERTFRGRTETISVSTEDLQQIITDARRLLVAEGIK